MIRIITIAVILAAAATVALAQTGMPMLPYSQQSGPMLPGLGAPMIPGNISKSGGGGGNCIEYQVGGCILYNTGSSNSILVQ